MKCPFCAEAVNDAAFVCRTCRRDFTPMKALMEAKQRLESKVDALEHELGALKAHNAARERSFDLLASPWTALSGVAAYVFLPIALAMLLHFIIVGWLDGDLLYLRLATAALPILCGYELERLRRRSWFVVVGFAIVVGVVSVIGMSFTTNAIDARAAVRPQDAHNRSEVAQYMTSIALAYFLGALLSVAARPLRLPRATGTDGLIEMAALFLAHNLSSRRLELEERTVRWRNVLRFVLSVVTAAGMIWTGFKRFLV